VAYAANNVEVLDARTLESAGHLFVLDLGYTYLPEAVPDLPPWANARERILVSRY
jgi:hypothetical protein